MQRGQRQKRCGMQQWKIWYKESVPFHILPLVARLLTEDFTKLFDSISSVGKRGVLVLAGVPNASPACEQHIQVLSRLVHQLQKYMVSWICMDEKTSNFVQLWAVIHIWCHGYGSKCFIKQRKVTTYAVMDMDEKRPFCTITKRQMLKHHTHWQN